ncbi:MAG: hypothetical protein BMS9Abin19_0978 [Gammaproteobacteria bacterium]|nr:MAG: hypothetical protein BMS9Abin19_0978 [Gammaproteobacteria bacterium]
MHFDAKHSEIFVIGVYDQIALTTVSGQLITIQELTEGSNVIAQQRTPAGWQFICRRDSGLTHCTLEKDSVSEIPLGTPREKSRTATWSPCGQFVAIGSEGTTLSVWNTQTGKQLMQKSIYWNKADDEFINPPTLSVIGWSETGDEIICLAEEIISSNVIVWNFKTQTLVTHIQ